MHRRGHLIGRLSHSYFVLMLEFVVTFLLMDCTKTYCTLSLEYFYFSYKYFAWMNTNSKWALVTT